MENILVSIRVRPLSKQEASKGTPWKLTSNSIALPGASATTSGQTYNFDRVFDPNSTTSDIYDAHTKKIISSAVQGFNGTIFAYGQTSSGKTFTMRGSAEDPGIIPLAVQDVFQRTEEDQNREFLIRVSYMEIYNEEIKDLLAPENCKLQIHENNERGIFVAGLREEIVVGVNQVLELMEYGEAHRRTGETNMNVLSSRSHAIFRMVIESRDKSQDDPSDRELLQNSDPVRVSHLNLVDLAGSERISKTGAEGTRLKEGTHINRSLMTLGNVINKLSEGIDKQGGHVPYRDSKLTRILQPALGGNARTVIICNITPAMIHVDETKGTLQFASRANRVTNCAQVNEILTDAALLKRQKKEIAELRAKLQNQERPSDQFEEEVLNLRNELLKTELERERMALELLEFQKAQGERERFIKEQEQKIENLSTMVINSAVDDRDYEKRSKRNNRRETWCARPQSGLPLGPNLSVIPFQSRSKKPRKEEPKAGFSGPSVKINRERSFGLPPPFERLVDEDETTSSFGEGSASLDDEFDADFNVEEGFSLPEPGPQSTVADRRRRSSNEWIRANELEQQLFDLQRQYDTLQCDFVMRMNEKSIEIDKLKKQLGRAQSALSEQRGKKPTYKNALDPDKRGRSLDGWNDGESNDRIKQLHAQVENLETEKLYMERELQRLSDQAREQSEFSRQELDEVCEELNLAKQESAGVKGQLDRTVQQVQQLEREKLESEGAYAQLASALKDLEDEVDHIREPWNLLQSSSNESLQLITKSIEDFQEYLEVAKGLKLAIHLAKEECSIKPTCVSFNAPTPLKSGSENFESATPVSAALDPKFGFENLPNNPFDMTREEDPPFWGLEGIMHEEPEPNKAAMIRRGEPFDDLEAAAQDDEEMQSVLQKETVVKRCSSSSPDRNSEISQDYIKLLDELNTLRAAVADLHLQINHTDSENKSLLQQKVFLEGELVNLQTHVQLLGDEKRSLFDSVRILEEGREAANRSVKEPNHSSDETEVEATSQLRENIARAGETIQLLEAEVSTLGEEKESLSDALKRVRSEAEEASTEKQNLVLKQCALEEKIESLMSELQSVEEEHHSCPKFFGEALAELDKQEAAAGNLANQLVAARRPTLQTAQPEESVDLHSDNFAMQGSEGNHNKWAVLETEVKFAAEELASLYETVETLQTSLKLSKSEEEQLLLREVTVSGELHNLQTAMQLKEDEKILMARKYAEAERELQGQREEMDALARKLISAKSGSPEQPEEILNVGSEVDRLIQEQKHLKEMVEVLHESVHQATKESDRLHAREAALMEEVGELTLSLQAMEDDIKSRMSISEDRLAEIERQKVELDETVRVLQLTKKDNVDAQTQISELTSLLSQKLDELTVAKMKLQSLEQEKDALSTTVAGAEHRLQELREASAKEANALEEWNQKESAQYRAEVAALKREVCTLKAIPGNLSKEKDSFQKDLEKTKSKLKEIEAKLKTTIQDKSKLETEKVNMERELKQLRQSTSLQRDINRRDSMVDQRRQSIALNVNKAKHQLSSVEHALQLKTEEVEKLTRELSVANELHAKLEFAMAEAESDLKEKLAELEGVLANVEKEKDAGIETIGNLQNELEAVNEQCKSKDGEVKNLRDELVTLKQRLQGAEEERSAAEEELIDAHMSFQKQKADLASQAEVSREKCNALNRDIVLLAEELEKVKKSHEESLNSRTILEEKFQQALEANSEKSLKHHKQVTQLEAEIETFKTRCKELENNVEAAEKRELEVRLSASDHLNQLRVELRQSNMNLSTSKEAEQKLSLEIQQTSASNLKLSTRLEAARHKLGVFMDYYYDTLWELNEIKRLLQEAGLVKGDNCNLGSLEQFEKQIKYRNAEAQRLEAELANNKMETVELQVQVENQRSQCERYQEEIKYLKSKVLSPEQEEGVREMVQQNKQLRHDRANLSAQLKSVDEKLEGLRGQVKSKDESLTALQTNLGSLEVQNVRLRKEVVALKAELDSTQQLYRLAARGGAIGKPPSALASEKRQQHQPWASNSERSTPALLSHKLSNQAAAAAATPLPKDEPTEPSSTFVQSAALGHHRLPLQENTQLAPSPNRPERKRERLFPNSERSKLSRSLGLGSRFLRLQPDAGTHSQHNKENFTMH